MTQPLTYRDDPPTVPGLYWCYSIAMGHVKINITQADVDKFKAGGSVANGKFYYAGPITGSSSSAK